MTNTRFIVSSRAGINSVLSVDANGTYILTVGASTSSGSSNLTAPLYDDSANDAFYSPSVAAPYNLSALLCDDSANDTFYAPTITVGSVSVLPSLYDDSASDAFYQPAVTYSNSLSTNIFVDADAIYSSSESGTDYILPSLVFDTDVFFTPSVAPGPVTTAPSLIADADSVYATTITSGSDLTAPLVTDADVIYAPTLSAVDAIAPGAVDDSASDAFYAPSVAPGSAALLPSLVVDADTVYSSSETGTDSVLPSLVADSDVVYSATVAPGPVILAPVLIADYDAVYVTGITSGSVSVAPPLYTDNESFYAPIALDQYALDPSLVPLDDVVYAITIASQGSLQDAIFVDADTLPQPVITTGPVTISPSLFKDGDTFWTAFIANVKSNGGGGSGGGNGNATGNIKYASAVTITSAGLIVQLQMNASAAGSVNTRMAVYADSAGVPGTLMCVTETKSAVAIGANIYNVLTPVSVLANTKVWVAFHTDGNVSWFLSNLKNGSKYNANLFSSGISNPFGSASTDNKQAPVFAIYMGAATININPSLYADADAFARPTATTLASAVPSFFVDADYIYAAAESGADSLQPAQFFDTDVTWSPIVSAGDIILQPSSASDSDAIYTTIAQPGPVVLFPAVVANDDVYPAASASLSQYALGPLLVADADAFYFAGASSTANTVFPDPNLLIDDTFYTPTIRPDVLLLPTMVADSDAVPGAVVLVGDAHVFFDPVTDADVFIDPNVTPEGGTQDPGLIVDADIIYASTATSIAQATADEIDNDDQFYVPTIELGDVTLAPVLIVDGDVTFDSSSSLSGGTYDVAPSSFTDEDVVYVAITGKRPLQWIVGLLGDDATTSTVGGSSGESVVLSGSASETEDIEGSY